jgi:hypothetical protein
MMSRKDYISTAHILKAWSTGFPGVEVSQIKFVVNNFADMFENDNPNFDRNRFKEAVYE